MESRFSTEWLVEEEVGARAGDGATFCNSPRRK